MGDVTSGASKGSVLGFVDITFCTEVPCLLMTPNYSGKLKGRVVKNSKIISPKWALKSQMWVNINECKVRNLNLTNTLIGSKLAVTANSYLFQLYLK